MKNKFLFIIALVLTLTSCGKEPIEEPKILTASPLSLSFNAAGGKNHFIVKARNVKFNITPSADWIEYVQNEAAEADGGIKVDVTVKENAGEQRDGKITLSGEGVEDVIIVVTQKAPGQKSLTASPLSLSFNAAGGKDHFIVKAENVEFNITRSADWIEYVQNEAAEVDGGIKVDVTVKENVGEQREGKITLSGEGVEDVIITVTQQAAAKPEIVWESSSAVLMNLTGAVKSVSYHNSVVYDTEDTLFEFDKEGYLTSFVHTKFGGKSVPITIAYDAQKRITLITGKGDEDYTISFEYGDHGQYISIEEAFYDVSYSQVISNLLWMPLFIKNLTKVTLVDSKDASKNMTLAYTVSGNSGSLQFTDGQGNVENDHHKLTFENGFAKTVIYNAPWVGEVTITYTLDPQTGHIIRRDDSGTMFRDHNNDAINSVKYSEDAFGISNYTYNADLDLVEKKVDNVVKKALSYEYDQQRNWIKMTGNADEPATRTVTYW